MDHALKMAHNLVVNIHFKRPDRDKIMVVNILLISLHSVIKTLSIQAVVRDLTLLLTK
jgi:hypothetical protein